MSSGEDESFNLDDSVIVFQQQPEICMNISPKDMEAILNGAHDDNGIPEKYDYSVIIDSRTDFNDDKDSDSLSVFNFKSDDNTNYKYSSTREIPKYTGNVIVTKPQPNISPIKKTTANKQKKSNNTGRTLGSTGNFTLYPDPKISPIKSAKNNDSLSLNLSTPFNLSSSSSDDDDDSHSSYSYIDLVSNEFSGNFDDTADSANLEKTKTFIESVNKGKMKIKEEEVANLKEKVDDFETKVKEFISTERNGKNKKEAKKEVMESYELLYKTSQSLIENSMIQDLSDNIANDNDKVYKRNERHEEMAQLINRSNSLVARIIYIRQRIQESKKKLEKW